MDDDIIETGQKFLIGESVKCNGKNSTIVLHNTMKAEGLASFRKNMGRKSAEAIKKLTTYVLKNPGRTLEVGAKNEKPVVSMNLKSVLSTFADMKLL